MLALTIAGATSYVPDTDADAAMKRFWEARQGGDATARLVRADEPSAEQRPLPAEPGTVSDLARQRV